MSPLALVEIIVLVALGIAALVLGGGMAMAPSQRRYEALRPVSWAIVFGSMCLSLTGLTNLFIGLSRNPMSERTAQIAFGGLAELTLPIMLAFGVLTVSWGLAALGLRKLM